MLPGVNIEFQNGNLQLVSPAEDGIFAVVASAETTSGMTVGAFYSVRSMVDVAALGIVDDVDNHHLYKFLKDYYDVAPAGNKVWIMPVPRTELMSKQFTVQPATGKAPIESLLDLANGEISGVFTAWNPDNTIVLTDENALDEDVWATKTAAQSILESYLSAKKSPVFSVIEGYKFSGVHADLPDLNEGTSDRVQIFIGANEDSIANASLGAYAGRLSVCKVSQNPGRKKFGALYETQCYIGVKKVEDFDIDSLHVKGYVTLRRHVKSSGYYITDCPMAADVTSDYGKLTRRRTIDKAYVLAYAEASKEVLEDFNLTAAGTIDPIYAGLIESNLKDVIYNAMTLNGELSADPTNDLDKGCEFKIDLTHPTGSTGEIKFSIAQVKVRGYAEYISIPLGYAPFNS